MNIFNTLNKKTIPLIALLLVVVFVLLFISSHGFLIVETSEDAIITASNEPSYATQKGKLKKKRVFLKKSGRWYVAARNSNKLSVAVKDTPSFMRSNHIKLDLENQNTSQKISSNGDGEVLFDDPNKSLSIVSSGGGTVSSISNGVRSLTPLLADFSVDATAPIDGGFVFSSKKDVDEGAPSYGIYKYDVASSKVYEFGANIFISSVYFISDQLTGMTTGLVSENKYYSMDDLLGTGIAIPTQDSEDRLVSVAKNTLYVFNQSSGELQLINIADRRSIKTINLPHDISGHDIAVGEKGQIAILGQLDNRQSTPVIYTVKEDLIKKYTVWAKNSTPRSLMFINDTIWYASEGRMWSLDETNESSRLQYEADGLSVISATKLEGAIALAAITTKQYQNHQIYNILLYPSLEFSGAKRLESILPFNDSQNRLYIDHYRDTLIVINRENNNSSMAQEKVKDLGGEVPKNVSVNDGSYQQTW